MSLTLYIDYLSQPSRAVYAFCLCNNIPFTVKETSVIAGGPRTPEFAKINRDKKVPAITHGDFALSESHAIMAYLASAFPVDDHWYPTDPKIKAKVDRYLHWHHGTIRQGLAGYIYRKIVRPKLTGREFHPELEKEFLAIQRRSLKFINNVLGKHKYIAETEQPSIADLSCFFECMTMILSGFDFKEYPNVERWINDIKEIPGVKKAQEKTENPRL